jgi:hypothetical protein
VISSEKSHAFPMTPGLHDLTAFERSDILYFLLNRSMYSKPLKRSGMGWEKGVLQE